MEPREPEPGRSARGPSAAPAPASSAERILAAVRFASEAFLSSQSVNKRIDEVLAMLGEAAQASRVYVFENQLAPDGALLSSQKYEWVGEGIEPQIDNPHLQRMSFNGSGLGEARKHLAAGRLYEKREPDFTEAERRFSAPQSVLSFVLVPLMVEESWWGFIGFDDCKVPREWSTAEKDALKAAGGILAAAIQGSRARSERQRLLDEQRSFTQAAWRRAAEWEAVLSSIVDAVWVLDMDEVVTFANEGASRIFDMKRPDDLLRPYYEYLQLAEIQDMAGRPISREQFPPCRSLEGEAVNNQGLQLFIHRTRQRKFVRMSSAPIQDASGTIFGAVAVATDVTEAVEFDRLKDQFVRVAAHELKTPVAIMKGYAQLVLRTAVDLSPVQKDRLEAIDRGADRIDRIVQDLLGVSQIYAEGFRLETNRIDLAMLAVRVIGELAREHPERPVDLEAPKASPLVVADSERIAFVLQSLIDNAIRYSPEGGPVEVRLETLPKGRGTLDRSRVVQVSVSDRGVGIPQSQQRRIFEPFFRAHTDTPYDHGGMGVGLFTSREIIQQHGGEIWFESEVGKGSTFFFQLPLGDEDEQRTSRAGRG